MRTLTEINAERRKLIDDAINLLLKRTEKGSLYSAEELSKMCDGLIPPDNFEASFRRGARQQRRGTKKWDSDTYNIFETWSTFTIVEDARPVTITTTDKETGRILNKKQGWAVVRLAKRVR